MLLMFLIDNDCIIILIIMGLEEPAISRLTLVEIVGLLLSLANLFVFIHSQIKFKSLKFLSNCIACCLDSCRSSCAGLYRDTGATG